MHRLDNDAWALGNNTSVIASLVSVDWVRYGIDWASRETRDNDSHIPPFRRYHSIARAAFVSPSSCIFASGKPCWGELPLVCLLYDLVPFFPFFPTRHYRCWWCWSWEGENPMGQVIYRGVFHTANGNPLGTMLVGCPRHGFFFLF